jgi:hypothetical protein
MSQDIKGDHFKLIKDIHQDMEDFIVEIFAQSCSKNGESGFTGDIVQDAGMGAIKTAAIIVTKQFKEFAHILVTVDVSKQVQ